MPWQVLLAMVTTCLLWGWALLRAGELLSTTKTNLLLPAFSMPCLQSWNQKPGSQVHATRRQNSKFLTSFGGLPETSKLWCWSGQTLRQRFKDVLTALWLPTERVGSLKALDIGSLCAGGATWHLQVTENSEYTRRKGRWLNHRVMEIYVQAIRVSVS